MPDRPEARTPVALLIAFITLAVLASLAWIGSIVTVFGDSTGRLSAEASGIATALTVVCGLLAIRIGQRRMLSLLHANRAQRWSEYSEMVDEFYGDPTGTDGSGNVISLASRRGRRLRSVRGQREADADPALVRRRRRTPALILLGLTVVGLVTLLSWSSSDRAPHPPAKVAPSITMPAAMAPKSPTVAPAPTHATTHAAPPGPGQPTAIPASAAAAVVDATAAPSTGPIGDGTYAVGVDVAEGAWSTGGLVNVTLGCQYQINGGRIVAVPLAVGATTVRLHAGDTFTTGGCPDWRWSTA